MKQFIKKNPKNKGIKKEEVLDTGEDKDMRNALFKDKRFALYENSVIQYPKEYLNSIVQNDNSSFPTDQIMEKDADIMKSTGGLLGKSKSQPKILVNSIHSPSVFRTNSPQATQSIVWRKENRDKFNQTHFVSPQPHKRKVSGPLKSIIDNEVLNKRKQPKMKTPLEKRVDDYLSGSFPQIQIPTLVLQSKKIPESPSDSIVEEHDVSKLSAEKSKSPLKIEPQANQTVLEIALIQEKKLRRSTSRSLYDHRYDLLPEDFISQAASIKPPPQQVIISPEDTTSRRSFQQVIINKQTQEKIPKREEMSFINFNDEIKHVKRITPNLAEIFDESKLKIDHEDITKLLKNNYEHKKWFDTMSRNKSEEINSSLASITRAFNKKINTVSKNCIVKYSPVLYQKNLILSKEGNIGQSNHSSNTVLPTLASFKQTSSFKQLKEEKLSQVILVNKGVTVVDPTAAPLEAFSSTKIKLKFEERSSTLFKPSARERAKSCLFKLDPSPNAAPSFIMFGGLGLDSFGDITGFTRSKWEEIEPEPHYLLSRYNHSFHNYQNKYFLVFGGSCSKGRPYTTRSNDLYSYSIAQSKWERRTWIETTPTATSGHASVLFSDYLIVFGGKTSDEDFNLESYVVKLSDLDSSNGVAAVKISLHNETKLLGLAHHCMASVFDLEDNEKSNSLHAFQKPKVFKQKNKYGVEKGIYVYGGIQGSNYKTSQELYMLKIMSPTYTLKKVETTGARPSGRLGHTMHYSKKMQCLIILHGMNPNSRMFMRDIWTLNLVTTVWTCIDIRHCGDIRSRGFHCSEYDDVLQRIYIVGGVNEEGYLEMNMNLYWLDVFETRKEDE